MFFKNSFDISSLLSISSNYVTNIVKCNHSASPKLSFFKTLFYLYLFMISIRYIIISILLLSGGNFEKKFYFCYDLTLGLFVSTGLIDGPLAIAFIPAPLLMIYLDWLVSFTIGSNSHTFQLSHDLLVTNKLHFFVLNQELFESLNFRNKLFFWKNKLLLRKIKLNNVQQMVHFSYLERSIRLRAIALSFTFDFFIIIFLSLFGFLLVFAISWYGLVVIGLFSSPYLSFHFILDASLGMYGVFNMIRISFFLVHCLYLIAYVHCQQQVLANRALKQKLATKTRHNKKTIPTLAIFIRKFFSFNFRFIKDLIICNHEILSTVLLFTMTSMFGLNIYSLASFIVKSDTLVLKEKMLLSGVIALQVIFCTFTTVPLMIYSELIHIPSKNLLFCSQSRLTGSSYPLLKLKIDSHYLTLNGTEKFAFTVGPMAKVTKSALFEVILITDLKYDKF